MTLERPLTPFEPKRLQLPLLKQQASEWCWAAVSQGVARYFEPGLTLSQCQVVSRGFKQACCGEYDRPVRSPACNRPGYLHEALEALGLLAKPRADAENAWIEGPVAFSTVMREIDREHPVCVLIKWREGGGRGHFIVVEGYSVSAKGTPYVFVRDPMSPESTSHLPYERFADQEPGGGYQDGQGRWAYSFLVKPADSKGKA